MGHIQKSKPIKTKMTNNYANIQRNKQIFNSLTKNSPNMMNEKITYRKTTIDLESMMTKIELKPYNSEPHNTLQRCSSSIYSKSEYSLKNKEIKQKAAHKPAKKRRKSFSLGVSKYYNK